MKWCAQDAWFFPAYGIGVHKNQGPHWLILLLSLILILSACNLMPVPSAPTAVSLPGTPLRIEPVLSDIGLVTAMEFTPDSRLFFVEKNGGIFTLDSSAEKPAKPKKLLQLAVAKGTEAGLLGLALAPDFAESQHFYIHYNIPNADGDPIGGRIVRYTERDNQALEETIIVDHLPAGPQQQYHFGGGLTFGPDGKLYLIFGDRNMPDAARDPLQIEGSILRYNPDGTIPADNPFANSPVYAHGIRNGFGLAFHPQTGQLYESENGSSCDDELNLILAGADYGWGVHDYDACPYPDDTGQQPIYQWANIIAPADLIFYTGDLMPEFQGDLLICGHNESKIYHVRLTDDGRAVREIQTIEVPNQYDLCRVALAQSPDGWIYAATAKDLHRIGR